MKKRPEPVSPFTSGQLVQYYQDGYRHGSGWRAGRFDSFDGKTVTIQPLRYGKTPRKVSVPLENVRAVS